MRRCEVQDLGSSTAIFSVPGYYIYAEASNPRLPGDRARLFSPFVTGNTCLGFSYNMHGSQMGSLRVYAKVGSIEQVMFEHRADTGDTWNGQQINIETAAQYQVSVSRGFFEWRSG